MTPSRHGRAVRIGEQVSCDHISGPDGKDNQAGGHTSMMNGARTGPATGTILTFLSETDVEKLLCR
jgi:hypothetical protein